MGFVTRLGSEVENCAVKASESWFGAPSDRRFVNHLKRLSASDHEFPPPPSHGCSVTLKLAVIYSVCSVTLKLAVIYSEVYSNAFFGIGAFRAP
jgi:hypothetical protein